MSRIEMGGNPNRRFVKAATERWPMIVRSAIDLVVAQNQFIIYVRAITGWPEAAARRLDRRLGMLADASRTATHEDYRREWRRRYTCGWKYLGLRGTGLFSAGPVRADELVAAMPRRDS